jgi:hypothetical protein
VRGCKRRIHGYFSNADYLQGKTDASLKGARCFGGRGHAAEQFPE